MFLNAARPQYSFINDVRAVCGRNYKHHFPFLNTIELVQQGIYNTLCHLVTLVLPFRSQSVELIEENHTRSRELGTLEDLTHSLFALTNIFCQQLWSFDSDKICVRFVSNCLGNHSLPTAWRTVKENPTATDIKIHVTEFLLLSNWENYLLLQCFLYLLQGTNIGKFCCRNFGEPLALEYGLHFRKGKLKVL